MSAWSEVEGLAAQLDRPDDLVTLYGEVLRNALQPEIAEMIGDRASAFCDEWFGDEPAIIEKLLHRVLELAPGSESALQRLSVIYTTAERWPDLLSLYDRALGVARDRVQRLRVLREAAQLAKDVANQPEKAIGYLQQLLPLVPDDVQVSQSLERLLERHERWPDLIALWESRLERESRRDRERSRGRIAACWLDNMRDPGRALTAIKPLLAEAEDDRESCALLERVIEASGVTRPVRDGAIELLRAHYDATARPRELIRVLERVISIDPMGSRVLREEAGARLADLEDVVGAMGHYAALLALVPQSTVVEEKLRTLAQRAGQHERYAEGIVAAARACGDATRKVALLAEAGRTRLEVLNDIDGAILVLQEAQQVTEADFAEQIGVNRRLAELYQRTNRLGERLATLERHAAVEPSDTARSNILGEAAKLAESLGETDRALSLWERRIDADPADLSGLDARIALLDNQNRWDDLVAALEARAAKHRSTAQKRADLVRVALVHHQQRGDLAAAISAWQRVVADAPDDAEAVMSLSELLSQTSRWREMVELLDGTSARDTARTVSRLVRLGEALHTHLDEPLRALAAYRSAIAVDPRGARARAGLTSLLQGDRTRRGASDALAQAFRQNNDATGVLSLLDARLADAPDDRTRFALLREAATLRLEHQRDSQGALADLARAFPMAPRDQLVEAQLHELAEATGQHHLVAMAYLSAIAALGDDPREASRLRLAYADLTARHLDDAANAAAAYVDVAAVDSGNRRVVAAVADLCGGLGRWEDAVTAVVRYCAVRERYDEELVATLDRHAAAAQAYQPLVAALGNSLGSYKLVGPVAALFHYKLAQLLRDQRHEPGAAIIELRRALERGGDRYAWLTELVELERSQGTSRPLLDALRRLAELDVNDLDLLVEAGDTASKLGDRPPAIAILGQVLARAAVAWRGGSSLRSSRPIDAVARWAVDGLVDLHRAAGNPRAAVDTLAEAARLPFDDNGRRQLRMRAAQLAASDLGDRATAIDMYRNVLAAAPRDAEVIERLAELLAMEDRVPEMLGLRKLQLDIETEGERRLQLRLEIANLVGTIEERGGRLEALLANLEDRPGHDPSIEAVSRLLSAKGQHVALADLLEKQAQRLEPTEPARAAKLWAHFAGITERDTNEPERAIAGHRRVVALLPTADSLRALARLNLERSQPTQAVPWLESLLGTVAPGERMAVVSQLARAHLSAHHPERAISAIESNLSDKEPAIDLRVMLAELYRGSEQWEPLARHLTRSLPLLRDDSKLARDFAREAAAIFLRLGQPAKAIPALETALALDPTDRELRSQLAIGQRVAGKLPEARAALAELIADFGRRRSPERAVLHVELARVAQAEGKLDEAMNELEQASKMDVNNAIVLKELAELARHGGQLDKAERTYKGLLLVVRRQPPGDDESAVGQSEVLFELHKLAAQRGDAVQAKEQLESAMDAAVQSDAEVRRLRRSLLAHGAGATLLHVLEQRLKVSPEPASQARLLADMADVLDSSLGRTEDALAAMLRAANIVPSRVELYQRARVLAKRTSQTRKFVETVESIVDRLRRKDDPPLIADLLMLAGDALELDAGDPRGAAALYRRVEMMGEKLAEAFYAQARIAAAQGDVGEQARTLDKMLELAGPENRDPSPAQVDALYRLAEIFISTEHRRSQGVELLERAFGAEPRWAQASRSLRQAAAADPRDEHIMNMYERVARAGGDSEILLDFLERRAQNPGATTDQIREAVQCAVDTGRDGRVEPLLERAVAVARDSADGAGAAPWAVLQLAERRLQQGELRLARDLTYEIAAVAEPQAVDGLAMRIATRALAGGEPRLAADIYEFLRERTPAVQAVWQPLLAIYRELRDGDRLASVLSSTLPHLTTPAERNALRVDQARFLIERLQRPHDALDVLREALGEDADDLEVAKLYEETLRSQGDDDAITEFLLSRFDDAQRRGNRQTTVDVALRLGDLMERAQSPDVVRVYRAALIVAPDDREILRRVVAHLGPNDDARETAVLMERLLSVETEERAPKLAWQLASAWESAGDHRAVQRTLELAYRAAPADEAVHDRLEKWYRDRHLWAELAELMIKDAERMGTRSALLRLREAATVYANQLGQPRKAAEVIGIALTRTPGSTELITEQANALAAAGDLDAAQQAIGNAIGELAGAPRVAMLLLRAGFRQQLGDDAHAVEDLEEAYRLDADKARDVLMAALERMRARAATAGERPDERAATLRLSQLHMQQGQTEQGRNLLVAWIERDPGDSEPLVMLCEIDESIHHWDGVIAGATRLAYVSTGEAQVAAALRAANAAGAAGRPGDALEVLELVHSQQPDAEALRVKLREMYEASGSFRELAGVLFADAEHGSDPEQRYANYRRAAELYLQLEDALAATPAAAKALELRPDDHHALMLNVDVLIASGQADVAGRTLEAAIAAQKKRSPELAVLQQRMGRVCSVQSDRDGQINWLKKAFDVDRKNPEVAAELAQLATELGDYELALKPLRAISLMDNPQPVTRPMALLWEAKIEHARGNRAKAELWAKKALREDPAFDEAQQFLDELGG